MVQSVTSADYLPEFLRDPEPRKVDFLLASVDDHIVEPPDMFEGRLPKNLADRAPRIVELEPGMRLPATKPGSADIEIHTAGGQAWRYEDRLFAQVGLNAVVGHTDFTAKRAEPSSFAEMRPGCYDIHARVRDMDIAGVACSLNFPSQISGFCGQVYSSSKDSELGIAVMRAWNDWLFEEWYTAYPDRIIPLGLTWLADPVVGAQEIRRNAARGFRAVSMPEMPHWIGYAEIGDDYWRPILEACLDTGTVICLHVGSSGMIPQPMPNGPSFEKNATLFPAVSLISCTEWLWSGVLYRYPELRIAMSEGGIGWVPMLLDRLDYITDHSGKGGGLNWRGSLSPVEVVQRNFWFCMLDDPSTLPLIERIGVDRIMVEVDYPHSDSTWPDCQGSLRDLFAQVGDGLTASHIDRITHQNAAELFRFPMARSETAPAR